MNNIAAITLNRHQGPALRGSGARTAALCGLSVLLLAIMIYSVGMGAAPVSPLDVLTIVLSRLGLINAQGVTALQETIVLNIRLPRVLLGALAGASLGVSGAALQGLFRNPLADPGLVGVSSGAALGAVAATWAGAALAGTFGGESLIYLTPLSAFASGGLTSWFVYRMATRQGRTDATMMILAGVAVNAVVSACIGILIYWSDDQQMRAIMFWMFGSLSGAMWTSLAPAIPFMLAPLAVCVFAGDALNLYVLGEREAAHTGVNVQRLKIALLATTALGVGAAVSLSGIIGFIGLAAPHLLRLIWGPDHRFVAPGSAIAGAALLLLSDIIARTWVSPAELPIGLVTSLLGGPFFLFLLVRHRRRVRC
ncbi:MAG: iron chelate uptake ABC transporter family permease subunit [bacterium]|nr:iron chelate uptake ABC transporter family permease subunit [bacterium]